MKYNRDVNTPRNITLGLSHPFLAISVHPCYLTNYLPGSANFILVLCTEAVCMFYLSFYNWHFRYFEHLGAHSWIWINYKACVAAQKPMYNVIGRNSFEHLSCAVIVNRCV